MNQFLTGAPFKSAQHQHLVLHAAAMAELLEELAERVHLLRDELWRLRAELGEGGEL
jgi:uncharacterized small protein (DUF1192 family)